MKMLFVFNPNSGKAQIKNQLMKIIQVFSKAGYEITVYPTKASLDGYHHILDNEGRYDVITCSGGDGTLNETVAAVLKYKGEKPPIGYIPSGTTNDFAASLGIPRNMTKAAVNIANKRCLSRIYSNLISSLRKHLYYLHQLVLNLSFS